MSREILALIRASLGLAQGWALFLLYRASEGEFWPATDGQLFAPLVLTAVTVPLLAIAGAGNLRLRAFAIWIAAAAVIVAALGAYDLFSDPAGGMFRRAAGSRNIPSPPLWLATVAGLAIAHTLVVSADADGSLIARYTRYFDVAWKHAVQAALAGAFAGALWILLFIGAGLFHMIGIRFFIDLVAKPWFWIPVTALGVAVAIHVTDVQPAIVRGVRTLALTLLSWLLPLFALIAAGFLATLLFIGLEPLWRTRAATGMLLVTAAALAKTGEYEVSVFSPPTPAEREANITVAFPKGQPLPAGFVQQDWHAAQTAGVYRHPSCLWSPREKCDAVLLDLDDDGAVEILLSDQDRTWGFSAYKETGGKWTVLGAVTNSNCPGVRDALLAGSFELVASVRKEIKAAGASLQIVPPIQNCP
jgi:hypothetical protein